MKMTRRTFLSASALTLLSCQLAPAARADCLLSGLFHGADTALPPKPLTSKVVDANPFMGRSESNIHHDCYNTDSTDAVLPVGICPEVNVAMEKTNPNASPAIFFDNFDNPVSPFLGGLAIRDLDAEEVRTIGFFSPAKHDGGGYLIQSSYSFVDGRNLIVCPTSHNHVLMLRATDENGTPLPVFEKVLDINIKEAAERYNVTHIAIDGQGVGEAVWQIVKNWFPAAICYQMSLSSKRALVLKMLQVIRAGRWEYDRSEQGLVRAFNAVRKVVTPGGFITYETDRSRGVSHGDMAWATMLSIINEPLGQESGGGGFAMGW